MPVFRAGQVYCMFCVGYRLLWPQLWPIHQFPIFCFAARGPVVAVVAVVAEQTCRRCLAMFGTETTEKVQDSSYHQCLILECAH